MIRSVGPRLALARQRYAMTVADVANKAGVDVSVVEAVERGDRDPPELLIAFYVDALRIDPGELYAAIDWATLPIDHCIQ